MIGDIVLIICATIVISAFSFGCDDVTSIRDEGNTTYIEVSKYYFDNIQDRIIITNDEDEFCKIFYMEDDND